MDTPVVLKRRGGTWGAGAAACKHDKPADHAGQSEPTTAEFPLGTATSAEACGVCHQAIYREFAYGFGADLQFKGTVYQSRAEKAPILPAHAASCELYAPGQVAPGME